jgi:hypothetical protein
MAELLISDKEKTYGHEKNRLQSGFRVSSTLKTEVAVPPNIGSFFQ